MPHPKHKMASVTIGGDQREEVRGRESASFVKSQIILFQSRKKFAFLYCLATVTGLFSLPGVLGALSSEPDFLTVIGMTLPMPLVSLLVTAGTYILNDLVDAELDRANGKKRPMPSGSVSRRQAWTFVALTFGTAFLLAIATFNTIGVIIVTLMLAIGITYSSPKIALMKRFVVKTVSIAIFYILCALLGITSAYNLEFAINDPILVVTILFTLAIAVFISSTLNEMGDVNGDKAAGRRTIPIVLGNDNTIKLAMILATSIMTMNWVLYGVTIAIDGKGGLVTTIATSAFALAIVTIMSRMRKGLNDAESMRKQHKKLFPLQMGLHPVLIMGAMLLML